MVARGSSIVDDIYGFYRSKSIEDSCGFSFVKSWTDLHRFDREGHGSLLDLWPFGLLWRWPPWQGGARIQTCEVGSEPSSSISMAVYSLSFQNLVQTSLTFSAFEFAKSDYELQLFSHFWNVNIVFFFFFSLAGWWNHLMVCWFSLFFLSVILEIFYIKACYCLHHWGTCSTFSFLLLLSRFFFFFCTCLLLFL